MYTVEIQNVLYRILIYLPTKSCVSNRENYECILIVIKDILEITFTIYLLFRTVSEITFHQDISF